MSENKEEWKDWDHTGYREIKRPDSYFDWKQDMERNPRNIPRDIKDED